MELPPSLSAKYRDSFAYATVKERLPVILAKVADTVHRSKIWVKEAHGEEGQEDLKIIAGCMSKLRNEDQTNKPLIPLQDNRPDTQVWNDYLREVTEREGAAPSWFSSPWLYVECFLYRRIQEAVEKCSVLKNFDVFQDQKQKALTDSSAAILILFNYMMTVNSDIDDGKEVDVDKLFKQFCQVSLWGNKCDLSISAGFENSQSTCPLDQVNTLKEYVLRNDLDSALACLRGRQPGRVDIVLDNAGFELITDLCLAEFLLISNLATSIHFHGKAFPWFVSDVTQSDLDFTLHYLSQSNSLAMNMFLNKWKQRLEDGSWVYQAHDFWTMPFDYNDMKKYATDLYQDLGKATLVFFKGDLNYRKLVGDRKWPTTTPFDVSLHGFYPAPLLSLRTLKADVVTGLNEGQAEDAASKEKDWMVNGNWAVMSFCDKVVS